MKKIYLNCIYERNLGDDLFIKIISEKYKNCCFYILDYSNEKKESPFANVKIIKFPKLIYRIFRKISFLLKKRNIIDSFFINMCDYVVSIGGSMFMENKNEKNDYQIYWYKQLRKKYFIIGANIGPVYTKEYIENIKQNIFKNAEDICLRDTKSYNMINDLNNARQASDIVYSLDVKSYINNGKKAKKRAVFSIIDCDKKANQIRNVDTEKYEQLICDLIRFLDKNGYEIQLFSFCKIEGDEIAINRIIKKVNNINIFTYYYDGDIERAMNELSNADLIVGTRFHANVIGMLLNKPVLPIIYNDKTRNLLMDLNFKGKYFDMDDQKTYDISNLQLNELEYICDVSKSIIDSKKHFKMLDEFLEGRENE